MNNMSKPPAKQLVVCIENEGYPASLEKRKIYIAIRDQPSEKHGLTREDLDHCHWLVRIATDETQPSMNLGQAVAVCLYELTRDPKAGGRVGKSKAASAREVERMTGLLFDALQLSGYVNPRAVPATEEKVRRLLRRMKLEPKDAQLWQGMLRQVVWQLRSEKTRTLPAGESPGEGRPARR